MKSTLKRGAVLVGACGGVFANVADKPKIVQALGANWVLVKVEGSDGSITNLRVACDPSSLAQYVEASS